MAITLTSAALIASAAPLALATPLPAAMQEAAPIEPEQAEALASEEAVAPAAEDMTKDSSAETQDELAQEVQDSEESAPADPKQIVVTGSSEVRKKDPLVGVNEATFKITQKVDAAFVEPIADVYEDDIPSPIRKGLRNFFRNLLEPVTALNYFLQLKPGKGFETLGRFAINTTAGVGGLFDVAKKEPFNLPYRRNGFSNTLGYYGVGHGPFLVLPLVGATTLRDAIGGGVDNLFLPFAFGKPFNTPLYAVPAYTVNSLEFRIEFDEKITKINESDDPYFAMREMYLCEREADIARLKNREPERDCSFEAIMGLDAETAAGLVAPEQQMMEEGATPPVEEADVAPLPEPEPPAIAYVSEPVIQPLPQGYVQAPPPSN